MSNDLLTQLSTYAEQLDLEAPPLESLTPASTPMPVGRPRRRWVAALATAVLLVAAIVVAVVTGLTGPEENIIDEPTSVPVVTTVPVQTTLPVSPTLPATTTLPVPDVPSGPLAPVQPAMGYNVMGSAPFVFFDTDGRPAAYYSADWLYDSPDRLAKCVDEPCSTLDDTGLALGPGSWLTFGDGGRPIRLQVEVGGEPVPRQTFGQFPASQVEGQPAAFAAASITVAGCVDPACTDSFRSTVLEVTSADQVNASNPDPVPYPGGGKVFVGPGGRPVIVYSGLLHGEPPTAAVALILCGDVSCSAGNSLRIIHRTEETSQIFTETLAFGSNGDPILTFAQSSAAVSPADGLLYPEEDGIRQWFVAACADSGCDDVDVTEIEPAALPVMAVGTDGYPVIAYSEGDDDQRGIYLRLCRDTVCTSATTVQVLDLAPNFAWSLMSPSLAIAPDGSPLVTAVEWTGEQGRIHVAKCLDAACSSVEATAHVVSDVSPATMQHVWSSAAAFDNAGIPVVAYYQGTLAADGKLAFGVDFLRCADEACSSLVP
ncbi:MAG: hypothetical protein ACR2OI_08195 [Acidimicrobiia bacterium]